MKIFRVDERAFFGLGESTVEVKNYKISSPMHGHTEIEVIFEFDGGTTEFLSEASLSAREESQEKGGEDMTPEQEIKEALQSINDTLKRIESVLIKLEGLQRRRADEENHSRYGGYFTV